MSYACKTLCAAFSFFSAAMALSQVVGREGSIREAVFDDESVRITGLVVEVADRGEVQFELAELRDAFTDFTVRENATLGPYDFVFSVTMMKTDDRGVATDGSFDLVYRLVGLASFSFQECRNLSIREKGRFDLTLPFGLDKLFDLSESEARQRCLDFGPREIDLLRGCGPQTELGRCPVSLADAICRRQYAVSRSINLSLGTTDTPNGRNRNRVFFFGEGDPYYDDDPVKQLLDPIRGMLISDGKRLAPSDVAYSPGAASLVDVFDNNSDALAVTYSTITGSSLISNMQLGEDRPGTPFDFELSEEDFAKPLNLYLAGVYYSESLLATTNKGKLSLLNQARMAISEGCKFEAPRP